jgi:N-acylneuraminate cytidylyltransferase
MENIAFFLPARKGSRRVKNKNTRPFAGIAGGLLENKLSQLIQTKNIAEILLSTNDDDCIEIAGDFAQKDARLKILRRPEALCSDTTDLRDLIAYVPTITNAKNILWGHVTTPVANATEYDKAIDVYLSKLKDGYDSLVGVAELKNFLLNKEGKTVNNATSVPWPRTQDLETLYEVNHVMFLAGREVYETQKNRIGKKPVLHVMDKLNSFDIDWEEDFMVAEMIFRSIYPPPPPTIHHSKFRLFAVLPFCGNAKQKERIA